MSVLPLRSLQPSDAEQGLVTELLDELAKYRAPNKSAEEYYEGEQITRQFGISIPPSMKDLRTVAGWSGTAVDVLEERLDWLGWSSDVDDFGLGEIYAENMLDVESGMAHTDALIFGVTFLSVGTGRKGEPSPLITPHSPMSTTALWDARSRRVRAALTVASSDEFGATEVTLYLPDETVVLSRSAVGGGWSVVDRDRHNLGRVPIVQMSNRTRGSRAAGRSEITSAVRYYTDAAVRTLLGMEVNREFYSAPQRVALNLPQDAFVDEHGNQISSWSTIQGRVWGVPPPEPGDPEPKVEQFTPASPAPYLDQVKGLAQMFAAEAGIPAAYLGFATENPASADAIRAGEARLVKRAERRQTMFGRAWLEVARLALMVRDGEVPDDFSSVSAKWRDAATPTRAAAADEASKLIGSGVLPADSSVTYDRVGLTPAEQRQLVADRRRSAGRQALDALAVAAEQARNAV